MFVSRNTLATVQLVPLPGDAHTGVDVLVNVLESVVEPCRTLLCHCLFNQATNQNVEGNIVGSCIFATQLENVIIYGKGNVLHPHSICAPWLHCQFRPHSVGSASHMLGPNSRICCSFALENRPKSGSIAPACLAMKMSNGVMTTRKEILIFHFSFFKRGLAHPREPHKKLCIGQSQTIMGGARTQDSGSGRRPDRVRKCCSVTSKLTRGW